MIALLLSLTLGSTDFQTRLTSGRAFKQDPFVSLVVWAATLDHPDAEVRRFHPRQDILDFLAVRAYINSTFDVSCPVDAAARLSLLSQKEAAQIGSGGGGYVIMIRDDFAAGPRYALSHRIQGRLALQRFTIR